MAQAMLSVRIDSEDKKRFESFCEQTGMNVSVAINMFVKNVLKEYKLPFEIKADPFYSKDNLDRLEKAVKDAKTGKNMHEHELIEVD